MVGKIRKQETGAVSSDFPRRAKRKTVEIIGKTSNLEQGAEGFPKVLEKHQENKHSGAGRGRGGAVASGDGGLRDAVAARHRRPVLCRCAPPAPGLGAGRERCPARRVLNQ